MDSCSNACPPRGVRSSQNDEAKASSKHSANASDWIDLTDDAKAWSRLLYPNPVCLLCTRHPATVTDAHASTGDNVMVLSWLTPVENAGRFIFSICERRWTAQVLQQQKPGAPHTFVLSVPVAGMEDTVKDIGAVSGRHCNKFEHTQPTCSQDGAIGSSDVPRLSKRQRRKRLQREGNIAGLQKVPFGSLFGIAGCVAHLQCQIIQIMDQNSLVLLDNHLLIVAQVERAQVHKDYWDSSKLLFRPVFPTTPPYLTFLGSQTFGHVTMSSNLSSDSPCGDQTTLQTRNKT